MDIHIIDKTKDSLTNVSYDDDSKISMVKSEMQVCSFDKVKEWYIQYQIQYANPNPKSNDALYCCEEENFFIEFKNGIIDNKVNYEIYKKIYDSLFILLDLKYCDATGKIIDSISYTREHMKYILVYNQDKYLKCKQTNQDKKGKDRQDVKLSESQYRNKLYKNTRNLGNKELILFGLDQFENYLFKSTHTYTIDEFKKKFIVKYYNKSIS